MNKLIEKLIIKRRTLVFEEADLVKVLNTINQHDGRTNRVSRDMVVKNCGWEDRTKWFVRFDASDKTWNSIVSELKVIRVWNEWDIPENSIGKVYSTD